MNILKIYNRDNKIEYEEGQILEFNMEGFSDIDKYISKEILPKMQENIECILIDISLSDELLDFFGLRLACHIRLSKVLGRRQFIPIVIISDFDGCKINKWDNTDLANIIFTKQVYLASNDAYDISATIDKVSEKSNDLNSNNFEKEFLSKIYIKAPGNRHNIANEWSIYQWSKFLEINNCSTINRTISHISPMLYFKYLINKYHMPEIDQDINKTEENCTEITTNDKVDILYIDDEWEKGWGEIFSKLINNNNNISLKYDLGIDFKKMNQNEIITICIDQIKRHDPTLIILDLRLYKEDENNNDINSITGIQILKEIPKINPGIQTIVWSATGDSQILDLINKISYSGSKQYNILGYYKKEHPEDKVINIEQNIKNISNGIKKGLKNKYLKKIHKNRNQALSILNNKIFSQYSIKKDDYEDGLKLLQKNMGYVFDILSSHIPNKYNYAMVSIATSLETIVKIFFPREKDNYLVFWDGEETKLAKKISLENKINHILRHKLGDKSDIKLSLMIKRRNDYMHSNDEYKDVTKDNIEEWFDTLLNILEIINNPPVKDK